jgi:uncharacterized membrane protein
MPYCCQCGKPTPAPARFCTACGAAQPAGEPSATDSFAGVLSGINDRTAAILCYIPWLGWIAAVIVIASHRYKANTPAAREVRFHAFQGLYLFVAWLIVDWVVSPALMFGGVGMGHAFRPLGGLFHMAILAAWIVMLVKVSHSEHYRLPVIGEMAERSVHEQGA